jgi:O-antigen ligase
VSERVASLQDAKALIAEQPIIGVGAGNFTAEIMQLQPERPVWSIQPAHNVFMLVWSELGLIGLILFGLFLFQVVTQSNKNVIFGIALLALVPSLFFDHWLWTSHFGLLFLFLLLGLSENKKMIAS